MKDTDCFSVGVDLNWSSHYYWGEFSRTVSPQKGSSHSFMFCCFRVTLNQFWPDFNSFFHAIFHFLLITVALFPLSTFYQINIFFFPKQSYVLLSHENAHHKTRLLSKPSPTKSEVTFSAADSASALGFDRHHIPHRIKLTLFPDSLWPRQKLNLYYITAGKFYIASYGDKWMKKNIMEHIFKSLI